MEIEATKYVTLLNQTLRKGCTAHLSPEGRIYYMNHETKISSWLPPVDNWDSGGTGLPYGWEAAVDNEGKTYYVNHVNKTSTYEDPRKDTEEEPPQPRDVELIRDPQLGFGFVAGSEKPVIVRFVTEGGPNEHKLMPGDQILKINNEDVVKAPKEYVIELIRSCKHSVMLTVCQPQSNNTTRKSALLTAAKKAKLKNNPSRVRFAEGVVLNGSPLYSPSPLDSYVPFLPNVLKVFLENGQTKSFKYDSTTTVQDVLKSLHEKLSIKCADHFSLVTEHVKIARRNRMAILDPKDTLAKIALRPGAHHLRCVYRVTFVPKDAYDLLQKDPIAFEYLYVQCCNDMVQERFAPELKYDIALRLAALHIRQHTLNSGMQGKITIKAIERECGLDRFVPLSLLETMKRKELRKLLSHFLKQNQSLCAPGQKQLTALQAKLHYLKIIGELPSYGAKCFSTNLKDAPTETALLISPKFGISQITCLRNTLPITLAYIEEISDIHVTKEDELSYAVEVYFKDPNKLSLTFSMEDRDAEELVLILKGYHRLLANRELPVQWVTVDPWKAEIVPCFHNRHTVREAPWSYPLDGNDPSFRTLDLTIPPPPYIALDDRQMPRSPSKDPYVISSGNASSPVDHNMNETLFLGSESINSKSVVDYTAEESCRDFPISSRTMIDERHPGIDYQSVISMELLENRNGDVDVDLFEARNDEVIKRISEMNRIVVDAETYLFDDDPKGSPRQTRDELDTPQHKLKAADSLLLLTQGDILPEQEKPNVVVDVELSPSESDTDSTPNDSPLHRSTPIRNSLNSTHSKVRRDSSFGLHSPDLLPGVSTSTDNIMEILKSLQSAEMQLPFSEGTLYLDPDIIDLTMIPPPNTPDKDSQETIMHVNSPPKDFLDTSGLQRELEKWIQVSKQMIDDEAYAEDGDLERENDSSAQKRESIDSARVVADLDHLCNALSEMNATSVNNSTSLVPKLPSTQSIDNFIATIAVPTSSSGNQVAAYMEHHDDLSAYIIPPPPSSSPSTDAQNEVIARFMAAAEDMRKMFGNNRPKFTEAEILQHYRNDLTPTAERNLRDIHQMWPQEQYLQASSHMQHTLSLFDKFALDSEYRSGDSSGYDTLTSSLTSYGETVFVDDLGTPTYNSIEEEMHMFNSLSSSADSTPIVEHAPSSLPVTNHSMNLSSNMPVQPHTKSTCLDVMSPLSLTSPSSTTSSDSSVILADGNNTDLLASELQKIHLLNSKNSHSILQTGSCDNLSGNNDEKHSTRTTSISRSISWTSMNSIDSPLMCRRLVDDTHIMMPKPPIPPNPFQQTRLRRSFRRAPLKAPVVPNRLELTDQQQGDPNITPSNVFHGSRSPSPSKTIYTNKPLNGIMPCFISKGTPGHELTLNNSGKIFSPEDIKDRNALLNGCVQGSLGPDSKHPLSLTSYTMDSADGGGGVLDAFGKEGIYISQCNGPFQQAQRDISTMVLHIKKLGQICLKPKEEGFSDNSKFNMTKEALVNESRQFVTSSKLFVKSAMESSDKMIENLAVCVALLNRMFAVSELVIMHMNSREQVMFLIEKLKDVALAYLRTVDAAHHAVGTDISNPHMGRLMNQATTLATTLTSLMRTLRVISSG